jgi:hypothetical protein
MSPRHPARRAFCLAGLAAALAGCGKKDEPAVPAPPAPPPPLARVNDRAITEADFQAEVARRLESKRPMADAATVLREMVEREVMLQEARRSDWIQVSGSGTLRRIHSTSNAGSAPIANNGRQPYVGRIHAANPAAAR